MAVNDITSIHPKKNANIGNWIQDGLLLGYEKSKGRNWLENSAGSNSQQPQVKAALDGAIIYRTDALHPTVISKVVDAERMPLVEYHPTVFGYGEDGSPPPPGVAATPLPSGLHLTNQRCFELLLRDGLKPDVAVIGPSLSD